MRALLDVNVLVALLDADHASHGAAASWFRAHAKLGWASCPITQNGCLRVMSHPSYPGRVAVQAIAGRLREATAAPIHEFWPDDVSLLDPEAVDPARIHGPRQVTDAYLLALCVRHRGRFVTFQPNVSLDAVPGARSAHLVAI